MKKLSVLVCLTFLSAASAAVQPIYKCVADIAGGIETKGKRVTEFRVEHEWRLVPYQKVLPLLESDQARRLVMLDVARVIGADLSDVISEDNDSIARFFEANEIESYLIRQTNENPAWSSSWTACRSHPLVASCGHSGLSFFLTKEGGFKASRIYIGDDADSVVHHGTCTPFFD